eukprot:TRINITY_DN13813_c0_g1_i1.p1 TRINITY_DN13813_c0_g1~~TRINITY_DN13813_c0_g1_i1.p1  ORF type:complete len:270 (-),score=46.62 TRINITY_DN13813_c0_g1_i1:160-948(-)
MLIRLVLIFYAGVVWTRAGEEEDKRDYHYSAFLQKAEAGDAEAQYLLGRDFWSGENGHPENKQEGLKWMTRSAENGEGEAMMFLAVVFRKGDELVKRDIDRSIHWATQAAMRGLTVGAELSLKLFQQRAGQRETEEDKLKDLKLAFKWAKRCAKDDSSFCQNELAKAYRQGLIVGKNYKKAVYWYRRIAEEMRGDGQKHEIDTRAAALNNLGIMYASGMGTAKNTVQALEFFNRAAAMGHKDARAAAAYLENQSSENDAEEL